MKKIGTAISIIQQQNGSVVFDAEGGNYYQTNEVGAVVVKGLLNGTSVQEIVRDVAGQFRITESKASEGVDAFIASLESMGLVK